MVYRGALSIYIFRQLLPERPFTYAPFQSNNCLPIWEFQIQFINNSGGRNAESVSLLTINLMHVQSCFTFKNEC